MKNPIQPTYVDVQGVRRFKSNALVSALLEHGHRTGLGLNELASRFSSPENDDDRRQLAQLIGYSVSGFGDLSYADDVTYTEVERIWEGVDPLQARVEALETTLAAVRDGMREAVATLYEIHPEDLKR